jgi:hypothetical protein
MEDEEEVAIMFWIISLTFRIYFLSLFLFAFVRMLFWDIFILE